MPKPPLKRLSPFDIARTPPSPPAAPLSVDPEVKERHRQLMAELNELAREDGKFKSREPTRPATPSEINEVIRGAFPFDDANARVTAEHLMAHLDRCGFILSRRY